MSSFIALGVSEILHKALADAGIVAPTPIQSAAIPVVLSGRNVFINAETGTGKTLAYLLPLLGGIDPLSKDLQVVILAPTHELVLQIQRVAQDLCRRSGLAIRCQALIGGVAVQRQAEQLKQKPHLVVGSVGRLHHLAGLRKLKLQTVKALVVDEMDRLLFGDTLKATLDFIRTTPRGRQLVFVSATARPESLAAARELVPDLELVQMGGDRVSPLIEHLYVVCEERDKPDMLRKLVHALNPERSIVFVHKNTRAETLAAILGHYKLAVADLHGARDKLQRKKAMADLLSGRARVLIASDLAARGLDLAGVTHIFNLDIPAQSKDYLHRVGRTGRAGAQGLAVSLVTDQETGRIRRYEKDLGITIRSVRVVRGEVVTQNEQ